jgi:hypothetical protein
MMSETKKTEAHTELRRSHPEKPKPDGAEGKAPELKPRTPADRIPGDGDEVDELFNDVPV